MSAHECSSSDTGVPRARGATKGHASGETTVSPGSASGSATAICPMGGPATTNSQRVNTPPCNEGGMKAGGERGEERATCCNARGTVGIEVVTYDVDARELPTAHADVQAEHHRVVRVLGGHVVVQVLSSAGKKRQQGDR